MRGYLKAVDIKDLRTDMAVQSNKPKVIGGEDPPDGLQSLPARERQPELLILMRGGDELVSVCLDADGDSHQHVLHHACPAGDCLQAIDLNHRVDDNVPDTGLYRLCQFRLGFVVAVQRDSLRRKLGTQGNGQLARRTNVQAQPLVLDPPRDLGAQECLGRVVHAGSTTECRRHVAAARTEVVLVNHEQRGAVLLGEFGDGQARKGHFTVGTARGIAGPYI
ncbi:Uncharacterised protein [Mycobacteroides abscessus subsp. abscessus]|nr:Uncharacterised protein [Mycobacteroides abscessus subsp. abscessus]